MDDAAPRSDQEGQVKAAGAGVVTRALGGAPVPRRADGAGSPERAGRPATGAVPQLPTGQPVAVDEVVMILVPGDMWNRMQDMGRAVGASGPIALINIALERLRRALAAGEE